MPSVSSQQEQPRRRRRKPWWRPKSAESAKPQLRRFKREQKDAFGRNPTSRKSHGGKTRTAIVVDGCSVYSTRYDALRVRKHWMQTYDTTDEAASAALRQAKRSRRARIVWAGPSDIRFAGPPSEATQTLRGLTLKAANANCLIAASGDPNASGVAVGRSAIFPQISESLTKHLATSESTVAEACVGGTGMWMRVGHTSVTLTLSLDDGIADCRQLSETGVDYLMEQAHSADGGKEAMSHLVRYLSGQIDRSVADWVQARWGRLPATIYVHGPGILPQSQFVAELRDRTGRSFIEPGLMLDAVGATSAHLHTAVCSHNAPLVIHPRTIHRRIARRPYLRRAAAAVVAVALLVGMRAYSNNVGENREARIADLAAETERISSLHLLDDQQSALQAASESLDALAEFSDGTAVDQFVWDPLGQWFTPMGLPGIEQTVRPGVEPLLSDLCVTAILRGTSQPGDAPEQSDSLTDEHRQFAANELLSTSGRAPLHAASVDIAARAAYDILAKQATNSSALDSLTLTARAARLQDLGQVSACLASWAHRIYGPVDPAQALEAPTLDGGWLQHVRNDAFGHISLSLPAGRYGTNYVTDG